jgi:spore coat polysaccharide biosynthesis protein SpsF
LKVVAIVQARMGSTRLPGKVLMDVAGKTMLARVVERLRLANLINEVLIATTDNAPDDAVVKECKACSVPVFRGDEKDVLDRYFRAAQLSNAQVIVRITSDCPLIDPEITNKTIAAFLEASPDYAANTLTRTYPRGLDTEVLSFGALSKAWQLARQRYEREHVTPYIFEHPADFKLLPVTGEADFSSHRWTVDTPEDLELIRTIYSRFDGQSFGWRDVLGLVDREPELIELNRSVEQKALHEG